LEVKGVPLYIPKGRTIWTKICQNVYRRWAFQVVTM